ncbi:MAG: CidA/LrgA family protein [Eubacteriales bacterium]|nr:CidA/LrgA family protein [Eubacteriales bacterium]
MKYLMQFGIIIAVSFAGELLCNFIPLTVPASIWGLVIMLILLITGVLKLEKVENAADFLINIMPPMFIPAVVGLLDSYKIIQSDVLAFIVINVLTTVIVMGVCGRIAQSILRRKEKKDNE